MDRFIWTKIKQFWNAEISRTVYATVAAHSNFISVGITQGFSAVMLPQLDVSSGQSSWIAGLGVISTPLGALLSGALVDYIGRKRVLYLPNIFYIFSWLLIGLASNIPLLYLGRALSGLAAGMGTCSYLYVCEIARTEQRGVLSALGPVFVSLGILMVYTLGMLFDWHKVALISLLVSCLSFVLIYAVPDSPSWYVSIGEDEKALNSIMWLRRNLKNSEKELQQLKDAQSQFIKDSEPKNNKQKLSKKLTKKFNNLRKPEIYKPFIILSLFFFFQEGSGIYIFLFYAVQIFREFGTNYNESVITITIGIMRLIMSILGAILMCKFGRRQLSIFSGFCMSLALIVLSIYLVFVPLMKQPFHFIPVLCIFFHVGFSMTGFLQLPFILSSEMFPTKCRGFMSGLTCSLGYILIFISVKIYPDLLNLISLQGVLWCFSFLTVLGVIFLVFFLPETKDKTFEEISLYFLNSKKEKVITKIAV